jgi:hypothetical protein
MSKYPKETHNFAVDNSMQKEADEMGFLLPNIKHGAK